MATPIATSVLSSVVGIAPRWERPVAFSTRQRKSNWRIMAKRPKASEKRDGASLAPSLTRGDPAPWFHAKALGGNADFAFDMMGGRHLLLLFFGSATLPKAREAIALVQTHRSMFDPEKCFFFGVTVDRGDEVEGRIAPEPPAIRYFLDYDRKVSTLYGASVGKSYRAHWVVLDPFLRVLGVFSLAEGERAIQLLADEMEKLGGEDQWAPVLRVPNVIEPELCRELIARYEAHGGRESGVMRDVGGKTVVSTDATFKQRRDWVIDDPPLRGALNARVSRRLAVPVERAFRFQPTRVERYMVSCYEAGHGHFRPHRDDTSKGSEHRRFAVTINLNDGYEGGDLRFPEFGQRTYRAPLGGAIVFSCSLLHEATPVTGGKRYVFLPFLFDEAGEAVRKSNLGVSKEAPRLFVA